MKDPIGVYRTLDGGWCAYDKAEAEACEECAFRIRALAGPEPVAPVVTEAMERAADFTYRHTLSLRAALEAALRAQEKP